MGSQTLIIHVKNPNVDEVSISDQSPLQSGAYNKKNTEEWGRTQIKKKPNMHIPLAITQSTWKTKEKVNRMGELYHRLFSLPIKD